MVDRTTVPEIAPLQADVCWTCQFIHQHTPREGHCAQCGDRIGESVPGGGYAIEIEYPLGVGGEGLPGHKCATLCGECAGWIASDINFRGVTNDPVAGDRFTQLLGVETERLNELESGDE